MVQARKCRRLDSQVCRSHGGGGADSACQRPRRYRSLHKAECMEVPATVSHSWGPCKLYFRFSDPALCALQAVSVLPPPVTSPCRDPSQRASLDLRSARPQTSLTQSTLGVKALKWKLQRPWLAQTASLHRLNKPSLS